MSIRDPWALLGVDRSATDREIKRAFREKSKQFHPDRNPGDEEAAARFQEIAQAYQAIKDEESRARWLAEHESQPLFGSRSDGDFPPFPGQGPAAGNGEGEWTQEIERTVEVSFNQAFQGDQIDIIAEVDDLCEVCGGSGAAPGSNPRICDLCNGTGEHGVGNLRTPCSGCRRGVVIDRPCRNCGGEGLVREARPFVCEVPPGVPDGYRMRITGPQRGRFGAIRILVTFKVKPSPVFERNLSDPADLLIEVPVTYSEAVLGTQAKIPTPSKTISLHVPPATPSGKVFRIAGEGMPRVNNPSERGDLYARIQIIVPEKVTRAQEKLIRQLADHDPEEPRFPLFDKLSEG